LKEGISKIQPQKRKKVSEEIPDLRFAASGMTEGWEELDYSL